MTHKLSRREQKAMDSIKPKKRINVTVDTKGIKQGIAYTLANLVAVFIFPFWLMYVQFQEWRELRERRNGQETQGVV